MRTFLIFATLFLIGFCLSSPAYAQQPGTLVTLAGGGQNDGNNVAATSVVLNAPFGMAFGPQGNTLYIAEIGNHRVRRVDLATGIITTVAGTGQAGFGGDGGPATQAQLNSPQAVALDAQGNLYIGDTGNARIRRVTPTGVISTLAGTGTRGLGRDPGKASEANFGDIVALNVRGNLMYISDGLNAAGISNNRVRIISLIAGVDTIASIAGNGSAQASNIQDGGTAIRAGLTPEQLTFDTTGNLFVADINNGRIRKIATGSGVITTVAGRTPTALELISGDLFKGDGGAATQALFYTPSGVAIGPNGTIYIGDTGNGRIRAVDPTTGTIVTIAGGGTSSNDGALALLSALNNPSHLLIDANGDLIFAETGSGKIRKFITPTFRTPIFHAVTTSIDFDRVSIGDPQVRTITVENQGNQPVNVQTALSSNPAFRINTPLPLTIGISQTAQIEVVFSPPGQGVVNGTITLTTSDPKTPSATFHVKGEGQAPRLGLLDNLVTFDRVFFGQSQTQSVRIANLGAGTLLVFNAVLSDSQFTTHLGSRDTLRITQGGNQLLNITFRPTRSGQQQARLTFSTNDPNDLLVTLPLQGTGQQAKPGGFVDIAPGVGLNDAGASFGAAWADFDGDGDLDLSLTKSLEPNRLFRNDKGVFVDVAPAMGVNDPNDSSAGIWGDVDKDGDLDLYVTNFGQPNRLFRNDGNTFTDIAPALGVNDAGDGYGAAWADFDRDGDLDLYVANFGPNRFYRNDGNRFVEMADSLGVADQSSGIQPAWGDYDSDGDPDLFLANSGPNRLFRNDGNRFADVTSAFNPADTGPSFGAAWGDYDNDGDLDLYSPYFNAQNRLYVNTNGQFSNPSFLSVVSDPGRGRGAVWGDFDNDGFLDLYVTNSAQPNLFYRSVNQSGLRTFVEQADTMGVALKADSRGVAIADVDGDGGLDIFVAVQNSASRLYRNREANGNWIAIHPKGTESGVNTIGLRLEIQYNNGERAVREVSGGASFLSQDASSTVFGVGLSEYIDVLTLRWPSGIVQQLQSIFDNLSVNRILTITEERPLPPVRIRIEADAVNLLANGVAETGLTAEVVNANGRLALVSDRIIVFRIQSGDGLLLGADSVVVRDGVAKSRYRTGQTPGQVVLLGESAGLAPGQITITLEKPFGDDALSMRTIAGSGFIGGYSGDRGPAIAAQLQLPQAVLTDAAGNIYIGDTNNNVVRFVNVATKIIETRVGTGTAAAGNRDDGKPAREGNITNPRGLAFYNGSLLLSELGNHLIRQVLNDTLRTFAGKGIAQFGGDNGLATGANLNRPSGIAVDRLGNLYIADEFNQRIRKVDNKGIITTIAGSGSPDQGAFSGDGAVALNARLNRPADVVVDSLGNLYIADTQNHRIRKVDNKGIITTIAGTGTANYSGDGGPATLATLNTPSGLTIDGKNHLFIADSQNHRIRLLDLTTGLIQTVAGTGFGQFDLENGGARAVSLNSPRGLAMSPTGTVLIADRSNHRIRELTVKFDLPNLFQPLEKSVDFNADGRLDFFDFLLFTSAFGSVNAPFDLNSDGQVGFSDFLQFATAYEKGHLTVRP